MTSAHTPTAVIIKGNPDVMRGNEKQYDDFYDQVRQVLASRGLAVSMDAGEDGTIPQGGDYWIGHSRGKSRLQYAPPGVKTLALDDYEPEADLEAQRQAYQKLFRELNVSKISDVPLDLRPAPAPSHYLLNDAQRQALVDLLHSKQAVDVKPGDDIESMVIRHPAGTLPDAIDAMSTANRHQFADRILGGMQLGRPFDVPPGFDTYRSGWGRSSQEADKVIGNPLGKMTRGPGVTDGSPTGEARDSTVTNSSMGKLREWVGRMRAATGDWRETEEGGESYHGSFMVPEGTAWWDDWTKDLVHRPYDVRLRIANGLLGKEVRNAPDPNKKNPTWEESIAIRDEKRRNDWEVESDQNKLRQLKAIEYEKSRAESSKSHDKMLREKDEARRKTLLDIELRQAEHRAYLRQLADKERERKIRNDQKARAVEQASPPPQPIKVKPSYEPSEGMSTKQKALIAALVGTGGIGAALLARKLLGKKKKDKEEDGSKSAAQIEFTKRQAPLMHGWSDRLVEADEVDAPNKQEQDKLRRVLGYMSSARPYETENLNVYYGPTNPTKIVRRLANEQARNESAIDYITSSYDEQAAGWAAARPAEIEQLGGMYDPLSHVVINNSKSPGVLLHEVGHGIDLYRREGESPNAKTLRHIVKPTLLKEWDAWSKGRDAYITGAAADKKLNEDEFVNTLQSVRERRLPAFGSYAGAAAGSTAGLIGGILASAHLNDRRPLRLPLAGMAIGGLLGIPSGMIAGKLIAKMAPGRRKEKYLQELEEMRKNEEKLLEVRKRQAKIFKKLMAKTKKAASEEKSPVPQPIKMPPPISEEVPKPVGMSPARKALLIGAGGTAGVGAVLLGLSIAKDKKRREQEEADRNAVIAEALRGLANAPDDLPPPRAFSTLPR